MSSRSRGAIDVVYLIKLFLVVFGLSFAVSWAASYYLIAPVRRIYFEEEKEPPKPAGLRRGEVVIQGLKEPYGLAFGSEGSLYFVDFAENALGRALRDSQTGKFSGEVEWLNRDLKKPADLTASGEDLWICGMGAPGFVWRTDLDGKVKKIFKNPYTDATSAQFKSIAAGGDRFWLAIRDRGVVGIFDAAFVFQGKIGAGDNDVHFRQPNGIFFGENGRLYVTDKEQNKIYALDSKGKALLEIDRGSSSMDALDGPAGIAVDGEGRVYVADTGLNRILTYDSKGDFLGRFDFENFEGLSYFEPRDLAVDPAGDYLYIAGGRRNEKEGRIWRIPIN